MAARGNSSTNLVLGAVGIAAAVVFLAWAFLSGGGETAAAPPAIEPVTNKSPQTNVDPHREARNKANWWFEEKFFDDHGRLKKHGGRTIHKLFEAAAAAGYPDVPGVRWDKKQKRIYKELLKREPDDPDANRAFGRIPLSDYPDFYKVFKRLTDAKAVDKEFSDFRNKYEAQVHYGPRWRSPALPKDEFERATLILHRFEAFEKQLADDPNYKAIFESLARIKGHPLLGKYETVHLEIPPFVLFYAAKELTPLTNSDAEQRRVNSEREKLRERLRGFRKLLNDYLAYYRKTWMNPLGLEDFEPGQLFYIWIFGDRESFDLYGRQVGLFHPPGLLGYFNPSDHWVFLFEDRKNRIQTETSLAHELTHQLHWHFSKDDKGAYKNHFRRVKAVWFQEGWAEYVGWCKQVDGNYVFEQPAAHRMEVFHICRKAKLPIYPIEKLVEAENYGHWLRQVLVWLPKHANLVGTTIKPEALRDVYFAMLYSESWLFVKFLNEKYKQQTLEFTKATLQGYMGYRGERGYARSHEVFKQIFKIKTAADWKRMQKEFDAYVEQKLYELPMK